MDAVEEISRIIEPSLRDMGYEVVRIQLIGGRHPTLQIMAEPANGGPMAVEDCAEISRAVSALLDVEDPIPDSYTLEVSSPGIDRPLTRLKDFERFDGFEAKIELRAPVDGRRRFKGRLKGVDGEKVLIEALRDGAEAVDLAFALEDIQKAKLLLTDELIEAEQARVGGQEN